MIVFSVTLYGVNEHEERNAAQKLWAALEDQQCDCGQPTVAMLIGEAKYEPVVDQPPMSGCEKSAL
jgi:hypothetical protein